MQNNLFHRITKQTQYNLSAGDIDLDIFPRPSISIRDMALSSNSTTKLEIKTIRAHLDTKSLVQKKIVFTKLEITNANLNFDINQTSSKVSETESANLSKINTFFQTNSIDKFIDTHKGLSININNFHHDFAEKFDATLMIQRDNIITGNLSITNFNLNKRLLKKYDFNKGLFDLSPEPASNLLKFPHLTANFKLTENSMGITINPTQFQYPSMTLGINFFQDKKFNNARLKFSGQNVNIDQARKAYFNIFKKNKISDNLFDVVRGGNASEITVLFEGENISKMLSPDNMLLSGQVENGVIRIPNTPLVPDKIFGTALIENGYLNIKADKGNLHNAVIKDGVLKIDLLNSSDYPFHGVFHIQSPLRNIKDVLSNLLKDTLLEKELKQVKNLEGIVNGKLYLELKNDEDLDVKVLVDDIQGSCEYSRAPGKIKINRGDFKYENQTVTLTNFAGKIGESYFYNFSGSYLSDNTQFLDIKAIQALINSKEVFDWLTQFEQIQAMAPDLKIEKGLVQIDSANVQGNISDAETLKYNVTGSLINNLFNKKHHEQKIISKGNLVTSCDFQVSDKTLALSNMESSISNIDIVTDIADDQDIASLATPYTLKDGFYKLSDNNQTFQGKLYFSQGPEVEIHCKTQDTLFSIQKLSIKDNTLTNAEFLSDKTHNIDPFKFKGLINTKTLEKLFNKNSLTYKNIIGYTGKKALEIRSKNGSAYQISAKTINLEHLIENLSDNKKNTLVSKKRKSGYFPKKHVSIIADSIIYKESDFKNFKADVSIKKNKHGYNGKLHFTSKDGKILSLTMLSRILSVINVSTLFKGKLPDVKQEGFKYNSIDFKADLEDNTIILNEAVVDGHDMALVFKGKIYPEKNELNLICLVAPFKTIDMLIEKIPLINTMLNNTLISIPVQISGKINDPTVVPMHPVSVGKGLINLMTNIIKTPIKLWDKIPKNSTPGEVTP